MGAPATPQGNGLDRTVGVLFFTTIISMGLWATGTMQLCFYYNHYPKDSRWLKVYVFAVWFLDTLHQALLIGMAHGYLINGFGDYERLMDLDIMLVVSLLVSGVICAMVQFIFILRIWRLSEKNIFIVAFVSSLVVVQLGAACLYFVKAVQSKTFIKLMSSMTITRIVNSVTAAADTAIAICLVVLLHRTRSGLKQSDTTINRLILFTINTGLVTSLCAVLGLVLGFVLLESLFFLLFYLMIARLYTNCMLAALNSRNSLRRSLMKASSNRGASKVSTNVFGPVTYHTNLDEYNIPPSAVPRSDTERDTTATQRSAMLDVVVLDGRRISSDSFFSRSLYSIDLEDLQRVPDSESSPLPSPTKSQVFHSTDNWI